MSSEVVKKRGRPKKVIPELIDLPEAPEVVKKTRAKSTKAVTKTVKAKAPTATKSAAVKPKGSKSTTKVEEPIAAPIPEPVALNDKTPVSAKAETKHTTSVETKASIGSVEAETKAQDVVIPAKEKGSLPVTVSSPILAEVQKLKEKAIATENLKERNLHPPEATIANKDPSPSQSSKITSSKPKAVPTPATKSPSPPKSTPSNPPAAPPTSSKPIPPPSKPRIPITAMNSDIVSNITTRAGARPNASGSKPLPPNYKSVSRKVTMAIVAMPIVIVTSYVLYQRLVLGEERKLLVAPISPPGQVNASTPAKDETAGVTST